MSFHVFNPYFEELSEIVRVKHVSRCSVSSFPPVWIRTLKDVVLFNDTCLLRIPRLNYFGMKIRMRFAHNRTTCICFHYVWTFCLNHANLWQFFKQNVILCIFELPLFFLSCIFRIQINRGGDTQNRPAFSSGRWVP